MGRHKLKEADRKTKINVTVDPNLAIIGKKSGNLSGFFNAAAKHFLNSNGFANYMKELNEKEKSKTSTSVG